MKARTSFITNSSSTCFMITVKNTLTFDDFIDQVWKELESSFKKSFRDAIKYRVERMEPDTTYQIYTSNEDYDNPIMQELYMTDDLIIDTPNFSIDYNNDYEDEEHDDEPDIDTKRSRKIIRLN